MIAVEDLYSLFKKCSGISTDTRKITEETMFFALKGENFDGNDYALDALKSGAKYAVVDRIALEGESFKGNKCIVVKDTLHALHALANYHRMQFDIPVIGITGTNGKTTTKELISTVLAKKYNVIHTQGNFNNAIGVPLTLLRLNEKTEIAVIEMGASAPGEIAALTKIVNPTCGIVTNVGKAHLQGFGSFDGVMMAKGELYDFLRQSGGTVFYNADDNYILAMINNRQGMDTVEYGVNCQKASIVHSTPDNPYLSLQVPIDNVSTNISTKLVGEYNASNIMAALCIGSFFNIASNDAVDAIENYTPSNNRSQFVKTANNLLIVDAYNANPTSMFAALKNFESIAFANKVLILGDMLELGKNSREEHIAILKTAIGITDSLYLVGKEISAAARDLNLKETTKCFLTSDMLSSYLQTNPLNNCTILIKGSNGTNLQSISSVL